MGRPVPQDPWDAGTISMIEVSLENDTWRFRFGRCSVWIFPDDVRFPPFVVGFFFFFSFPFFFFSVTWFLALLASPSEEEEGEGETNEVEGGEQI